jgi:protease-4
MSRSTKWFIGILVALAVIAGGFILVFVALISGNSEPTETVVTGSGDKIAVVELKGEIASSEELVRQLKKYREQKSVKGILLRIDSPGGAVVPSQEMYEEVKKTRDGGKPVVVSMGSLAASGGYYVACGASRLVANRGTLTGSIGVISEFWQFEEAMHKLGLDMKTIKSGKLKDAGIPTRAMTEEDQKYFQDLINDTYRQFTTVVETERKLSHDSVLSIADGRVFTGEQAVRLGLVDTLGTFEDAVRITGSMAGIHGEPAIVRERRKQSFFQSLAGEAGEAIRDIRQDMISRPLLSFKLSQP